MHQDSSLLVGVGENDARNCENGSIGLGDSLAELIPVV